MKKNQTQIARRYSNALFELAIEGGYMPEVALQARAVLQILDPGILAIFKNPGYEVGARKEVLELLLRNLNANPVFANFMFVVADNGRMPLIREILEDFLKLADEHLGIRRVDVIAARPLTVDELASFEQSLAETLRKKIVVTPKVDETLKAGYIVKIGNTVIDASLRSRLASIKESLSHGV